MLHENTQPKSGLPDTGYLRQSQLIPGIVPVSSATLWRMVKTGDFPQPIKLSARTTVYPLDKLIAWRDAQAAQKESM